MKVPTRINPQTQPVAARTPYLQDRGVDFSGLAQQVTGLGKDLRVDQLRRESFDLNGAFIKETNDRALEFERRTQLAEPGAANFTDIMQGDYATRNDNLVKEYKDKGYSDETLQDFQLKLRQLDGSYIAKGLQFQGASALQNGRVQIKDRSTSYSQYASANPDAVGSSLEGLRGDIDLLPDISAPEKQALFQAESPGIIMGALQGLARTPEGAKRIIQALDPQSLAAPAGPGGKSSNPWGQVAVDVASQFGLDPAELAAVMSFETGGTFSSTVTNASGHMGLIQFGKAEQAKYGITKSSSPEDWTRAIAGYFKDRGLQPGASIKDVYSTILTGSPGNYNATDSNGTNVNNAVPRILADHLPKAKAWLGEITQAGDFGNRADGTPKGNGWLGVLQRPDGNVSTEISVGVEIDGKETEIPLLVPDLTKDEQAYLLNNDVEGDAFLKNMPESIMQKAEAHAKAEIAAGRSPFKQNAPARDPSGKTGVPALDLADAQQQAQALAWARTTQNQNDVAARAAVQDKIENETAALQTTGQSATTVTDQELAVLGPQGIGVGEQLKALRVASPAIAGMKTASAADMQAQVQALLPTNTAAPDYSEKLRVYNTVAQAAQQNLALRKQDPRTYVASAFPKVQAQAAAADTPEKRRAAYTAIAGAYRQLGIPQADWLPMAKDQVEAVRAHYEQGTPASKIAQLQSWNTEMSATGLLTPFLQQMSAHGGTAAGDLLTYSLLFGHPERQATMSDILNGAMRIKEDPAQRPDQSAINKAWATNTGIGKAISQLNPTASVIYNDQAAAIYVSRGGRVDKGNLSDPALYRDSVRRAVGGLAGNADSGVVSFHGTSQPATILPPAVTRQRWENWLDGLTPGALTAISRDKLPPLNKFGKPVLMQDIKDEGIFIMRAPGQYAIQFATDGGTLKTGRGTEYIVNITPQVVR